ncbi:hypothetical protein EJB05_57650 [Eragrostis curvula]|uniref:Inositol polyphosphate-related phosphatase domain-containing protein n=1 Tax=Eragrostis curvula TaxID=38414 RepID=A0A5J9SDB6_9POAL|nr:hypothetical protein EJB05_57650 [Eragrostis curvula]
MASSSSSLSSSSLSPSLQARQDHPGAAMVAPLGSPQTALMTDHEGNQTKDIHCRLIRQTSEIVRSQHIDVKELRICVGTWNVGGICPPTDLDIQEWLDMKEPADIYVLGFQEIIPLEAGYMIGSEDNRPIAVWEHIIGESLNKKCPDKPRFKYFSAPPSPSSLSPSDYAHVMDDEFLSESNDDNDGELHPLIELDTNIVINDGTAHAETCKNPTSTSNIQKDKDFSRVPSKYTFDHSQETCLENLRHNLDESNNQKRSTKVLSHSERLAMIWPEQQLDMFTRHLQDSAKSSGSDCHLQPLDLACNNINNRIKRKRQQFVQIISKQMVGIFLSIWVQKSLRKHIQNLRLSILGVGKTPYIGNKASAQFKLLSFIGSVSVSMSIHQTYFCFVCCHLAAGEKDGDELKRNAHVEAIHRRTVFDPVPTVSMPRRIRDHERIIWLGDLNYRINLSYEKTLELISKQDWDGLFEKDQLKKELRKGCTFDGWVEGLISFPPTYKYEFNSQKYVSDETASGRRTPSWCDRILSNGKGIKLLSYKRAELTFSDHRPVTAIYTVETEVLRHRKLQRALTHF